MQTPDLLFLLLALLLGALMVMGYGAQQMPGGNDSLLLWAIPGLTLHGLIAYAVMACVITAAFFIARQWPRASR